MNKAIIVDLDGTLCDCSHRLNFIEGEDKKWREFHKRCINDSVNSWCQELINSFQLNGYEIILLTGREETYRDLSEKWLSNHSIKYKKLFMRASNDRREDFEVKKEIFNESISPCYKISFVVEDRLSVTKMWRKLGVTCLQCDWGDF